MDIVRRKIILADRGRQGILTISMQSVTPAIEETCSTAPAEQVGPACFRDFQDDKHRTVPGRNAPDDVSFFDSKGGAGASIANAEVFFVIVQIKGVEIHALLAFFLDDTNYFAAQNRQGLTRDRLQQNFRLQWSVLQHVYIPSCLRNSRK